jgi:lysophospholipase L1-like esterase
MKVLLYALVLVLPNMVSAAPLPAVEKAKRIVFLGDSITYGGHYVTCIDAWLTMKHPGSERVVINLGLSSETVSGLSEEGHAGGRFPRPNLHERLSRILAKTKPDLVFACYGMNCGIYQPADPKRLKSYQVGILKLREAIKGELIHITPWSYDHSRGRTKTKDYNEAVLGGFTSWLLERKEKDGWHVIDLHGPMSAEILKRRKADPEFTFQRDGVHPNEEGHWFAAQQLIRSFGDEQSAKAGSAVEMMNEFPNGGMILPLVTTRMKILRDAWLSETKHLRPGVKAGLPMEEAEKRFADLTDLIRKARTAK